ncbi:MAG: ATP-binding protein [Pseudomonadota bacterium]|nr:ATP-binding protein [Pseudomonadota bacterium]
MMKSPSDSEYLALVATIRESSGEEWKTLWYYNAYRLGLAIILFTLAVTESMVLLHARHAVTFTAVSIVLVFTSFADFYIIRRRTLPLAPLSHALFLLDIAMIGILIFSRDDFTAILAVPLMVTVGCASTLFSRKIALAYAALCSLMVLFKQTLEFLHGNSISSEYFDSGVAGLGLFTTALAGSYIVTRAKHDRALVRQQRADLSDMDQINKIVVANFGRGVVAIDGDSRVITINEIGKRFLGLPAGSLELPPPLAEQLREFPSTPDNPNKLRYENQGKQLSIVLISLANGALLIIDDETETIRQAQRQRFASLGRMAGSVAHEIRNPLSAIGHAAQLLSSEEGRKKEDLQLIDIISNNARRINNIIEAILNLNRNGSARPTSIKLRKMLEELIEACSHSNAPTAPNIVLKGEETAVIFDAVHLEQVVTNLCQNALKYGKSGGIAPEITFAIGTNLQDETILDVLDSGPGVKSEQLKSLFEPFSSSDPQSTGLGLYITRRLCELNHARIKYLNDTDGHRFRITFQRMQTPSE